VTEHDYDTADIAGLTMADFIRKRPEMYFGVGRGDPRLATELLCAVAESAFHPAAKIAASHTPHVVVEITADLEFSVTDDQADALTGTGVPELHYEGSLLTAGRWSSAATAALSSRAVVEVWRAGQGFRQTLVGLRPVEAPAEFDAPEGAGTRVVFSLDPAFLGSSVITTDIATLDVHGPHCTEAAGSGEVIVRDRRCANGLAEHRYTGKFTKKVCERER
jgi:DNA gyrase/topoisomerase IV subunit B